MLPLKATAVICMCQELELYFPEDKANHKKQRFSKNGGMSNTLTTAFIQTGTWAGQTRQEELTGSSLLVVRQADF